MFTTIKRRPERTPGKPLDTLPPILQRVYARRGVDGTEEVDYSLSGIIPPEVLLNANAGARLVYECMQREGRVVVVGDYDADGATSTALFIKAVGSLGYTNVRYLVPNRFKHGYGLTPEIVAIATRLDPALIITVDNGISSIAGVAAAKAEGLDVLITDHHLPGEALPQADVIINPNQPRDDFPSKNLAGVGVVFYLLLALRALLRERRWFEGKAEPNLAQFLDIVAVGTVADVVGLDHNNRTLVEQGLRRIRAGKCCAGIRALLAVSGKDCARVTASDLGFVIGPRLNAAGRLQDMSPGIECLLADDEEHALALAGKLNELNEERKRITLNMQSEALDMLASTTKLTEKEATRSGITLYDAAWHQGVTGIVAGRIKERFHRPAVVFAKAGDDRLKGSARSIAGLHVRDALALIAARHPDLIITFGGHAMAAGLTIAAERLGDFARIFDDTVEEIVSPEQLQAVLLSDGELDETELSLATAELISRAGPWGQGFAEPVFDGVFDVDGHRLVGERHLKLHLIPAGGDKQVEAIAFNVDGDAWNGNVGKVRVAYRLEVNEFRGARSLQLNVQYLAPAEG